MRKLFTILALPLLASSAFASTTLQFGNEHSANYTIHKTMVTGNASGAHAELYLGTGDASNCQTSVDAAGLDIPSLPAELGLDGNWLAGFGLDYTCAKEVYTPNSGNGEQSVSYGLHNDGKVYDSANPNSSNIELNQ
jgi:hypothetical protein